MIRKLILSILLFSFLCGLAYAVSEPENLIATPGTNYSYLEWNIDTDATYYHLCYPEPTMNDIEGNVTPPIIDGVLDTDVANVSQKGILRSPNPETELSYDWIYAVHDDNNVYMAAVTIDNDNDANDDYIGVYFDFDQNGLDDGDYGYRIQENGNFIRYRRSGSAWIAYGGSTATTAVGGAGTHNIVYEFQIPRSELPEYINGNYIDIVVRRTNTFGATTTSFFPDSTAYSIDTTDGWQTLFIGNSLIPQSIYEFNTTDNYYTVSDLDIFSWYEVGVASCNDTNCSDISCVEFVTLDYPRYNVTGHVYDEINQTIENALIVIEDSFTLAFTYTDSDGYYIISGLHNDNYTLTASKYGYDTNATTNITISDADAIASNMFLTSNKYTYSTGMDFLPLPIYIMLIAVMIIFVLYGFYLTDRDNYTHIILSLVSGIIGLIVGYNSYIGIGFWFTTSTETNTFYYQDGYIGGLFVLFAIFMMIYSIVRTFDIAKEEAEEHDM